MVKKVRQDPRPKLALLLCNGPGCRRFALAHRLLRKDGVFLHAGGEEQWLCSTRCLEAAVTAWLERDPLAERLPMPRLPRMPFRLILLQRGLLGEEQLRRALAHGNGTGPSLSRALLQLRLVSEEDLAAAHAAENGCAFFTLPPAPVCPDLRLPRELARREQAVTLHGTPDRILVGFVHRIDRALLTMVEQLTGRIAQGCFLTASRHAAQLAFDGDPRTDSSASRLNRQQVALELVAKAVESGAEAVHVGRTRKMLWVRYRCGSGACVDQLLELADQPEKVASVQAGTSSEGRMNKKLQVL